MKVAQIARQQLEKRPKNMRFSPDLGAMCQQRYQTTTNGPHLRDCLFRNQYIYITFMVNTCRIQRGSDICSPKINPLVNKQDVKLSASRGL
jgi:hypothetical protein